MKNHTKNYLSYFGYDLNDFVCCEICGAKAVDIHHIEARGMGGSKLSDEIKNIMALCRLCHVEYGDKKQHIELLKKTHYQFIKNNGE